jgi:hypothetical protein
VQDTDLDRVFLRKRTVECSRGQRGGKQCPAKPCGNLHDRTPLLVRWQPEVKKLTVAECDYRVLHRKTVYVE